MPFIVSAQQKTVNGKITSDKDGSPISGATILAKGSKKGTQTAADGSYILEVPAATTKLVISSVGFGTQELTIGADNTANLVLKASNEALTEVVVIGYGTARKRDLTGSVGSVKAKDFNQGVQISPDQLIQGKVAGVQVTTNSGQPGGATTIRIRGNSSLSAGSQPLFVVDGIIFDASSARPSVDFSALGGSTPSNPLNFINPNDIASMDVLKDASATAIYGSRGANGVVIVTTKKGIAGAPKLELGFSSGTSSTLKKLKVLDAAQYKQALSSYGLTNGDFGANSDAFSEISRKGKVSNITLGVSGGNEFAKYRFSGSYLKQDGIIKGSDFKKLTAGINSQFKLLKNKALGLDVNLLFSKQDESLAAISTNANFTGNLIATALQWNPTRPLRKADGSINNYFDGSTINPLEYVEGFRDNVAGSNFIGSISPSFKILKNLEYRLIYGFNVGTSERRSSIRNWVNLENNGINNDFPKGRGNAAVGNGSLTTQTITNTLNYNTKLTSNLSFSGLLGFEYFRKDNKGTSLAGRDFVNAGDVDYTDVLSFSLNNTKRFSSFNRPVEEIQSIFGRLNFDYKGKYLVTATVRRDGSSKFGENNKYGIFPSFSAAWNIAEESFLKGNEILNDLKLRIGWGLTGNQEFPSGSALSRYTLGENNGGITLSQLPNPTLKWQKDGQTNIGLDFSILKRRVSGSVDYFNKTTTGLLFPGSSIQPAPPAIRWNNLDAKVINKGFEITLNASIISKKDFSWDIAFNATFIKNKVSGLSAPVQTGALFGQGMSGTLVQIITNDQPLNTFYTRDYQGVDKTTGQSIYTDNGNVFYNVGNPNPNKILGISTTLTYKKISLGVNFNGAFGHKIYNNTANSVLPIGNLGTRNIAASLFNTGESLTNPITASSRYLEKGDYLKLANTTLSYNFGAIGKNIGGINVYITGQNLFVSTKYTGFDPEVNTLNNTNQISSVGIDYIGYPSARTFLFGANINF
jgi:TonB-dependent starch-binding outer membrane protein SusC